MALVEFAGVIAADRLLGEISHEGSPVNDETDAFHQLIALAAAGCWINENVALPEHSRKTSTLGDIRVG